MPSWKDKPKGTREKGSAGYAVRTGQISGIVGIDLDRKNGVDGVENWEKWCGNRELPATFTVATPSGGKHLYFAIPPGVLVKTCVGVLAEGVDVRGEGGLLFGPGSVYKDPSKGLYKVESNAPIAEAPPWLLDALPKVGEAPPSRKAGAEKGESPFAGARPVGGPVTEGGRNDALTRQCGVWRAKGLEVNEMRVRALAWNKERCDPPLDEEEVRSVVRSVARYEPGRAHAEALGPSLGERTVAVPRDWLEIAPPPRRWLLQYDSPGVGEPIGVLPRGKLGVLAGAGAVGKTTALVRLAVAIATEREWFSPWHVEEGGRVLLALGEEDEEEIRRRIFKVDSGMNLTEGERQRVCDRIVCLPLAGIDSRMIREGAASHRVEEIREILARPGEPWTAVIFDPLARFGDAETEVSNGEAAILANTLESFCAVDGEPTVLLAHHTSQAARMGNTNGANSVRGVTGLTDNARWVALMAPVGDGTGFTALDVVKTNYSLQPPPIYLGWNDDGWQQVVSENDVKEARIEAQARSAKEKEEMQAAVKAAKAAMTAPEGGKGGDDDFGAA